MKQLCAAAFLLGLLVLDGAAQQRPSGPLDITPDRRKLDRSIQEIDDYLDERRRQAGFPPRSDIAGTNAHCERLIVSGQQKIETCLRDQSILLGSSSEAANVVADAIVGACFQDKMNMLNAIVPYCVPSRADAGEALEKFIKSRRDIILSMLVRLRTLPPPTPTKPPAPVAREY